MKNLIIVLILSQTFNIGLRGQEYVPFPTENANWNVYLEYSKSESPTDTTLLRYTLQGDTIINQVEYRKICLESGSENDPVIEGIGGLREEDKKIYFFGRTYLGFDNNEEVLLYDFNKQIEDTIFHDSQNTYYTVIEDIDAVEIDGVLRKRYKVNSRLNFNFEEDYWIEGIGSIWNGLLGHITDIPTCCYNFWENICFKQDGVVKYLNPTFDECCPVSLLASVDDIDPQHNIRIYPIPLEKDLYIENNTDFEDLIVRLIDANGVVLNQSPLTDINTTISLSLNSGIYIVLIMDSKGQILKKVKAMKL